MNQRAKVFKYKILEVFPLSKLEEHKDHNRLRVFYHKGTKCVNPKCDVEGTIVALGKDGGGGLHLDVYTDDFYPLTVDHTIPKSKGGSNELSNLEPMCARCNSRKGNTLDWDGDKKGSLKQHQNESQWIAGDFERPKELKEGMEVYKSGKRGARKYKKLGVISKFVLNPHINEIQFMLEGNEKSMYHLKKAFVKV